MHRSGRIIELSLLTLLRKDDGYGYKLANDLIMYNLIDKSVNIGVIYRALRNLESKGLIDSYWEDSDDGPNKRIYRINEKGVIEINHMLELLKERRKHIDTIINLNSNLED